MTTQTRDTSPADDPATQARNRRRRSQLLNHFIAYFGALVLLVPLNFVTTPDRVWFVYPMVAWMAPLALHTAWAMGLFDRKR